MTACQRQKTFIVPVAMATSLLLIGSKQLLVVISLVYPNVVKMQMTKNGARENRVACR